MTAPRKLTVAVLAAGFVLAGCGSGSEAPLAKDSSASASAAPDLKKSDTPKTASGNACDIVSDEVVAAVLGVAVVRREGHRQPGSESASCIKGLERSTDPKGYTFVTAGVVAGGGAAATARAAAIKGTVEVSGLGDRAFYLASAGVLTIADGDDLVQAQVVKSGVPGSQQDCITIAKDILSRRS